jgi:Leucine-rich repeat (LRR) protein
MTGGWFHTGARDATLVFVHGVLSDNETAWLYKNKEKPTNNRSWPELVMSDKKRFNDPSIFLGGYYTDLDSGEAGVSDCARELLHALVADYDNQPPVVEFPRITFVCHSLGGIITRYMLERYSDTFGNTKIGLVLLASPSYGSDYATALNWLLTQYTHKVGKVLWGSPLLEDLDGRFRDVQQKMSGRLAGIEFNEHHIPYYSRMPKWARTALYPFLPGAIVLRESACRYFNDSVLIQGSDHNSICKPPNQDSRVHTELAVFLRKNDLLPTKHDPNLAPLELSETKKGIEALRHMSVWLTEQDARNHREALGALRSALAETRRYMADRTSGQERRSETENLLSQLWFKAAMKLRPFNSELAMRCEVKGHGWAESSVWESGRVQKLAISLNAMLDDLIGEELAFGAAAKPQEPPARFEIVDDVPVDRLVDGIVAEKSAAIIEQAVRRKLDIPRGELTTQDFAEVKELDLSGTPISTLAKIGQCPNLSLLDLSVCTSLSDLNGLAALPNLLFLTLRECMRLDDLSAVAGLDKLIGLNLEGCTGICDLGPLSKLRQLQSVDLTGCWQVNELTPLARLDDLRYLSIKDCQRVVDLGPLGHLRKLEELYMQGCTGVRELGPLSGLSELTSLDLGHCRKIRALAPISYLRKLGYLGLMGCSELEDLGSGSQMLSLPILVLTGCSRLKNLTALSGLKDLQILVLSNCVEVEDINPLSALSGLGSLALNDCRSIRDITPLVALTKLRELDLQGCPAIEHIPDALARNSRLSIIGRPPEKVESLEGGSTG